MFNFSGIVNGNTVNTVVPLDDQGNRPGYNPVNLKADGTLERVNQPVTRPHPDFPQPELGVIGWLDKEGIPNGSQFGRTTLNYRISSEDPRSFNVDYASSEEQAAKMLVLDHLADPRERLIAPDTSAWINETAFSRMDQKGNRLFGGQSMAAIIDEVQKKLKGSLASSIRDTIAYLKTVNLYNPDKFPLLDPFDTNRSNLEKAKQLLDDATTIRDGLPIIEHNPLGRSFGQHPEEAVKQYAHSLALATEALQDPTFWQGKNLIPLAVLDEVMDIDTVVERLKPFAKQLGRVFIRQV